MSSTSTQRNPYLLPFALVCSLFFLWGIANSLNGSLVKQFQTALDLNRGQAGIVDSAFYLGYFIFAIPAGIFMRRFGYKRGILAGLLLYAAGALLFYPAAGLRVYAFFLFALFTIASGLAFLETAANLYVTVLGDKKEAEWRINFAQSFNGISIILGPAIGSFFIFSGTDYSREELAAMPFEQSEAIRIAEALATRGPYLAIAALVLFVAFLFWRTKMPEVGREEEQTLGKKASVGDLLRHRHLVLGVLAQFANVGAQVTLWSYFVDLKMGFSNETHLGVVQSIYPFEGKTMKQIAGFHASFAMILFMLGRFLGTWLMSRYEARRVLVWYSIGAVGLVVMAYFTGGLVAVICLMLTYFCQSIMFPTIFALATKGLPPAEGKLASSLVIMAIVGGAILPPLGGWLSHFELKYLLLVPLVCFVFVVWYVVRGYAVRGVADIP
ncbi:MAG: L-fucose:H+ symporter permease [Saprospiraceae bacterium]|nr:L-fucose:H+ symporter permease [Saprospiraceae bacterium]